MNKMPAKTVPRPGVARACEQAIQRTGGASRALTSGAIRCRSIPIRAQDTGSEAFEDETTLSPDARALGRPCFEGLIFDNLDDLPDDAAKRKRRSVDTRVKKPVEHVPPLPAFRQFHSAFRTDDRTPHGDIRTAFFLTCDEDACEYLDLDDPILRKREDGQELLSAAFIISSPPGLPTPVSGQVNSRDILVFMPALDVSEIHGYCPDLGLRVSTPEALGRTDKK